MFCDLLPGKRPAPCRLHRDIGTVEHPERFAAAHGNRRLQRGPAALPGDQDIDGNLRQGFCHDPLCPLLEVGALRQEDTGTRPDGGADTDADHAVLHGGGAADDRPHVAVGVVGREGEPVARAGRGIAGEAHARLPPPRVVAADRAKEDAPVPGPVAGHDIGSAEYVALRELPVEREGEVPHILPRG